MKIIGLTGGIASGKSTVARLFEALGAITHSADDDARAVLAENTPLLGAVFAAFPETRRADGSLDRAALGARIFGDPDARERLEGLVHPAIVARMSATIDAARNAPPGILIYETPLLFELGLERLFDATISTAVGAAVQAERLRAREAAAGRPPLSDAEIADRLSAQLPEADKIRRADFVIPTGGTIEETRAAVGGLWARLQSSQA